MNNFNTAFIYKNPQSIEELRNATSNSWCLFVLVTKPGAGVTVNGMPASASEGLAILPPRNSERSLEGSFNGYLLGIDWSYLKTLPHWDRMSIISNMHSEPWRPLSSSEAKILGNYFHMMADAIKNYSKPFGASIFENLVQALTASCLKFYPSEWVADNTVRLQDISNNFIKLAGENFEQERELSFYADKLCITPKYLSDVIVKVTGKNAMKWLEEYTMEKARDLLVNSSESISSISRRLNFYTPSDFCKYFKKASGTTPLQFRKSSR